MARDPAVSGFQLIALIGHELQHAVEIAGAPGVVDSASLATFYRETGFESPLACGIASRARRRSRWGAGFNAKF